MSIFDQMKSKAQSQLKTAARSAMGDTGTVLLSQTEGHTSPSKHRFYANLFSSVRKTRGRFKITEKVRKRIFELLLVVLKWRDDHYILCRVAVKKSQEEQKVVK